MLEMPATNRTVIQTLWMWDAFGWGFLPALSMADTFLLMLGSHEPWQEDLFSRCSSTASVLVQIRIDQVSKHEQAVLLRNRGGTRCSQEPGAFLRPSQAEIWWFCIILNPRLPLVHAHVTRGILEVVLQHPTKYMCRIRMNHMPIV